MTTNTLTVREVARRRGVSLKAVYDQLAVGRVPGARKVGRVWRIPIHSVSEDAIRKPLPDGGKGRDTLLPKEAA